MLLAIRTFQKTVRICLDKKHDLMFILKTILITSNYFQKEVKDLLEKLEQCKAENDVDCNGGSNTEARFLRRLVRRMEGDECLEALKKARRLREGEGRCECKGKGRKGEDKDSEGGSGKGPAKQGEGKQDSEEKIEEQVERLLSLLKRK